MIFFILIVFLYLIYIAQKKGGNAPCVLNAANEVAVARFLADEISFLELTSVVEHALSHVSWQDRPSIESHLGSDAEARAKAAEYQSVVLR